MDYSIRDIDAALLDAAERGDIDEVKHLINEGADVNAKDVYEKTPLHWAAEKGHKEIVEILLKKGADVNGVESFSGMTSLWLAAQNGHESLVEVLLTAENRY